MLPNTILYYIFLTFLLVLSITPSITPSLPPSITPSLVAIGWAWQQIPIVFKAAADLTETAGRNQNAECNDDCQQP